MNVHCHHSAELCPDTQLTQCNTAWPPTMISDNNHNTISCNMLFTKADAEKHPLFPQVLEAAELTHQLLSPCPEYRPSEAQVERLLNSTQCLPLTPTDELTEEGDIDECMVEALRCYRQQLLTIKNLQSLDRGIHSSDHDSVCSSDDSDTSNTPFKQTMFVSSRGRALPKHAWDVLITWFKHNTIYPSKEDKIRIAIQANVTEKQVSTWFTNARRRCYD